MTAPTHIYDISVQLRRDMPVFPGDPAVAIDAPLARSRGDAVNVSRLRAGIHSGTHVDAPFHVDDAWPPFGAEDLPLLVGPARVVEVATGVDIDLPDLSSRDWLGVERVLFKTGNFSLWDEPFRQDRVGLTPAAAAYLKEHTAVRLVGIDYLSIENAAHGAGEVHRALLGAGVLILEGLDLSGVAAGDYYLVCLPLKLDVADGALARAVLLEW
ncbi:MAG: cyclase family protein [Chloroflexi bacterium]|nr:cyclase family protein [Chloroflexota bacterium]